MKGIKSRLENRQWPDAADAVTTLASYWTCKLNEPDVQTDVHVSFGAKKERQVKWKYRTTFSFPRRQMLEFSQAIRMQPLPAESYGRFTSSLPVNKKRQKKKRAGAL